MTYPFHTLDVFTTRRFTGNPVAVIGDAQGLDDNTMQAIAGEFNLSETVFLLPPEDGANTARARIFTPARELPFAGHPTVGTAVLLASLANPDGDSLASEIRLEEGVGVVPVAVTGKPGEPAYAELSGAVMPTEEGPAPSDENIASALSLNPGDIGFAGHLPAVWQAGNSFLFVPLASRRALAQARCDMTSWPRLGGAAKVGVYLYCAGAEADVDFHARLFAPEAGVIEDPATGSAAATMPVPLAAALKLDDGAHKFVIAQGEDMGRRSRIHLAFDIAAGSITAVRVGGHAVMVSHGEIDI